MIAEIEAGENETTQSSALFVPPDFREKKVPITEFAQIQTGVTTSSVPKFVFTCESDALDFCQPQIKTLIDSAFEQVQHVLGFRPGFEITTLLNHNSRNLLSESVSSFETSEAGTSGNDTFILPLNLEFPIHAKELLSEAVSASRKNARGAANIFYDEPALTHRLIEHAFFEEACRCLELMRCRPEHTGLLLVAPGESDPNTRAESYKLMRILWERLDVKTADVAFLRDPRNPFPEKLEECRKKSIQWIVLPQLLWAAKFSQFASTIFEDFQKKHLEVQDWKIGKPIGQHSMIVGWLVERILKIWNQHRSRHQTRETSPKHRKIARESFVYSPEGVQNIEAASTSPAKFSYGDGVIAMVSDSTALKKLLDRFPVGQGPFFVKVTWHGYATGTYTDPVALDRLLSALPGKAILLEGHTSSRNKGGREFDWETESREHRIWIRDQERDYLERTGLQEVMDQHGASYLNVTENFWDGQCADAEEVRERLAARGVEVIFPELLSFIPQVILDHPEATFISFARFKGPTRLSISNCFGLIPVPLRTYWHGQNIRDFARVCCDMARIYGTLLNPFGMVESFSHAVRWNRQGIYRSRWGNYDLIPNLDLLTMSPGLSTADVLASRLQGQDVSRSAFFDVVRETTGVNESAQTLPIDESLIAKLA